MPQGFTRHYVVRDNAPNNPRSGITNILKYLQTIWLLKCRIGNRRVRRTYLINEGWSLLILFQSAPLLKSSRLAPLSPVQRQYSRYRVIHIYISRLDKSDMKYRNINNYQTKIYETHMEEVISLLSIMRKFRVKPNAWDKDSSVTKGFWVSLLQRLL